MVPMYEITRDELRKLVKKADAYAAMLISNSEEFDRAARFAADEIKKGSGDSRFWVKLAQYLVVDPETKKEKEDVVKEVHALEGQGQQRLI